MPNVWTLPDFVDGLKTLLEARPGLSSTTVYDFVPPLELDVADAIVLGYEGSGSRDVITMGGGSANWDETADTKIMIRVIRPGSGPAAKRARDALEALFDEVVAQLEAGSLPTVAGATVQIARISWDFDQFASVVNDTPVTVAQVEITVEWSADA